MSWFAIANTFLQVQTNFQQITDSQFVITIPDADQINHLVVFLTGASPFPEGFGGSGWLEYKSMLKEKFLHSLEDWFLNNTK